MQKYFSLYIYTQIFFTLLSLFKGFALGFFWILISEYNNPKRNNFFFKKKEPDMFTEDEIQNWNKPYYQKK
ncbi:hypothetical protein Py17XNL_000202720 [Plasmodium yoelii yoelii]|uniref:Uncharacterized protein n=1 Tax=Plasmodium yoelii yoelii TaxID=73239 RepID=A0AAF0AZX2_PLAYO|nr:hypothetical protein Py17XNL_000202720 [Plasmodium yoelii yoelii]